MTPTRTVDGSDAGVVGVVIPAYNAANWIEETLASVAAQTVASDRLDVVVVDDGSTDGTAAVADRVLSATRLSWRVLRVPNGGPSRARNVGWRAARGEWVQFLDADDLLAPGKLAGQLAVANLAAEDVAVVYSDWVDLCDRGGKWVLADGRPVRVGTDPLADLLARGNFAQVGALLFRRGWLNRVGGWHEEFRNYEDLRLLCDIAVSGGRYAAASLAEPGLRYRVRPGSLSKQADRADIDACLALVDHLERQLVARGELTGVRRERVADLCGMGVRRLAAIDWAAAAPWVDRLLALDPGYRPYWSPRLRLLARAVGLRRALRLTAAARAIAGWARGRP